jgi:hypothetical protein
MNTQPTPEAAPNAKGLTKAGLPRKRALGAGRRAKRAGRRRVPLLASIDREAFAEIHRRASHAGQTVNDWLTAHFDPRPDA